VKDELELKVSSVYTSSIPCEGEKLQVEQSSLSMINEHFVIFSGIQSALAEHSAYPSHRILLNNVNILGKKSRRWGRFSREETEIELRRYKRKIEDGISLNRSWKPLIPSSK
jgi:hypothetical protein